MKNNKLINRLTTIFTYVQQNMQQRLSSFIAQDKQDKVQHKTVPTTQVKQTKKRKTAPTKVDNFIRWFISAPEEQLYNVKRGQWECICGYRNSDKNKEAHKLVFHSKVKKRINNMSNVLCIRPVGSNTTLFNASRITHGYTYSVQHHTQRVAEEAGAIPIPFQVLASELDDAELKLSKVEIIEWGGAERMLVPPVGVSSNRYLSTFRITNRHFAGAVVIRIDNTYFLFDADREELKYNNFNPFLVQLPRAVSSIDDAYNALMPKEVHKAIADGKSVVRQGELFFVEMPDEEMQSKILNGKGDAERILYNDIFDRLITMGAAVVNWANQQRLNEIHDFIKSMEQCNDGKLPDTELNAKKALSTLVKTLNVMYGPEMAHVPKKASRVRPSSMLRMCISHTALSTHLGFIHDELTSRLHDESNVNKQSGPDAQRFNIVYNQQINNHEVTAVYRPKDANSDEVYVIGGIVHIDREHRPIFLDKWHRVYPNTAVNSWAVSGDVD